jgi:RNA polymerase sigma-70 factor (ECF subfamily)
MTDEEFSALYAAHDKVIRRSVFKILISAHAAGSYAIDVDDVMQETWLRVYVHYNEFAHRAAIRSWITRVALNAALAALRNSAGRSANVRRRFMPLSTERYETEDVGAWSNGQRAADARYDINRVVALLHPIYRDALRAKYLQGETPMSTAERTGTTLGTVKNRLHRAHKAARRIMEEL